MMITKVTKAYQDDEKNRMKKEAEKQSRILSALGKRTIEVEKGDLQEESTDELCNLHNEWEYSFDTCIDTPPVSTANSIKRQHLSEKSLQDKETQTEPLNAVPSIPVCVQGQGKKISMSSIIGPRYLEAMALLMSENLSASEAIKVVHTVDTVIWGQKRHLPLRLDKNYMSAFKALKKMKAHEVTANFTMIRNDEGGNGNKMYQIIWFNL